MPDRTFRPAFLLASLTALLALSSGCADDELTSAPPLVCADPGTCSVSARAGHTCALLGDGTVACWGANAFGQVGKPVSQSVLTTQPLAARVDGVDDAVAVAVADTRACALLADGGAMCWGSENTHDPDRHVAREVPELTGASDIAAGSRYVCALVDGQPACWGTLTERYRNDVRGSAAAVPIPVYGVTELALGDHHACALLASGTVSCWGYGEEGQLGIGPTDDQYHEPQAVPGVEGAVAVAAGSSHACALLEDGDLVCWGNLEDGTGVEEQLDEPTVVAEKPGADSLVFGRTGMCVLVDGEAWCRGSLIEPQQDPAYTLTSTELVSYPSLSDVDSMSIGTRHLCTATDDGFFRCWGANLDHQLGTDLPSGVSTSTPVLVRAE